MYFLIVLLAGLVAAPGLYGQAAVVRSVGQYEPSGTVLYSVYVASRSQSLGDLTVTSALPPGTRFLENVDLPKGARYEGVADNVIAWTVPEIAEDSILGPFTYRLKLDGPQRDVPSSAAAAVAFQRPASGLVETPGSNERLAVLGASGSVTFDQRGTLNAAGENGPVPVGDTGILLHVPDGAVGGRTTVTFRRLNVEENTLPASAQDTWWCALYQTTVEPQVAFQKEISIVLPTRRPITPGLTVNVFTTADLAAWQQAGKTSEPESRNIGFGVGTVGGTCFSGFQQFGCSRFGGFGGGFGGFGISTTDKSISSSTGTRLTTQLGQSVTAAGITDGTSNIIAILIGRR